MKLNGTISKLVRVISFVLILAVMLLLFSYMLAPKDNTKSSGINNPNANGFFSEPRNTIDITVIGNSDAYSGFSPMELWNRYGYTSYVSAEGAQTVSQAYTMLNKVLSCHKPKVVILETDGFFTKSKLTQSVVSVVCGPLSDSFSVFQYHDRWKNVRLEDLLRRPKYTAHCFSKGQRMSNKINGYIGSEYMIKTDKKTSFSPGTLTSLDAFRKVCETNGIKLIFVELPSESSWNYAKHNTVQEYADNHGIPFLDLNIDRRQFGFDWERDTRDKGNHLNNSGARKTTMFIGKYLHENFDLPDHRNDGNYKVWHRDYQQYKRKAEI